MKIVLLKNVKGIGRAHEEIETKDGYALNYLLPKGLAVAATPTAVKEAELRRKQAIARKEVDTKLFEQNMAALADAHIVIRAKANEKGHLYDAVGEQEIRAAAKAVHIDLPEDVIRLEKPLKEVGTFKIPLSSGDIFGAFSVVVEAE